MPRRAGLLLATVLLVALASNLRGDDAEPGWPEALRGFKGTFEATVVRKTADRLVLRVEKVKLVFRNNAASDPHAAVGKELTIAADDKAWLLERGRKSVFELNVGDSIHGDRYSTERMLARKDGRPPYAVGWHKLGGWDEPGASSATTRPDTEARPTPAEAQPTSDEQITRLTAQAAELEKQLAELKAENESLKRQLGEARAID